MWTTHNTIQQHSKLYPLKWPTNTFSKNIITFKKVGFGTGLLYYNAWVYKCLIRKLYQYFWRGGNSTFSSSIHLSSSFFVTSLGLKERKAFFFSHSICSSWQCRESEAVSTNQVWLPPKQHVCIFLFLWVHIEFVWLHLKK